MKINWGTGIAIFMGLFILTLVWVVFKSLQVDHSLVKDNYYEEDLKYQQHYEKKQNAISKPITVKYTREKQQLILDFPGPLNGIKGTVHFFKPDNQRLDHTVRIQGEQSSQLILSTAKLTSGLWRLKIDYIMDGDAFYHEQKIVLKI